MNTAYRVAVTGLDAERGTVSSEGMGATVVEAFRQARNQGRIVAVTTARVLGRPSIPTCFNCGGRGCEFCPRVVS
jgi:hypothetical protein